MDTRLIVELISAVGFPITACLLLGWFIFKIYKKGEEREAALRTEIEDCQEVNKSVFNKACANSTNVNWPFNSQDNVIILSKISNFFSFVSGFVLLSKSAQTSSSST